MVRKTVLDRPECLIDVSDGLCVAVGVSLTRARPDSHGRDVLRHGCAINRVQGQVGLDLLDLVAQVICSPRCRGIIDTDRAKQSRSSRSFGFLA